MEDGGGRMEDVAQCMEHGAGSTDMAIFLNKITRDSLFSLSNFISNFQVSKFSSLESH